MIIKKVFDKCVQKGLTIAFAESMTGGGACYAFVKIPGASKVVKGGMVLYQKDIKSSWLDLDLSLIDHLGLVSQALSNQMAYRIQAYASSNIGIGITGNAGPTQDTGDVGFVSYISIYYQGTYYPFSVDLNGLSRQDAIELTIQTLYQKLDDII